MKTCLKFSLEMSDSCASRHSTLTVNLNPTKARRTSEQRHEIKREIDETLAKIL